MPWGNNPNYPPEQYLALGSEFEEFIDRQGLASLRQQLIESLGGNSHRRIAAALGEQIEPEQVPEVFHQVLKAAINTATGEPSN
jgi:hypothetical protein